MVYFKVVKKFKMENDIAFFYLIKRKRFFLLVPYWSSRIFNNSRDCCRLQYRDESKEIIRSLQISNKENWFKKIIKKWL